MQRKYKTAIKLSIIAMLTIIVATFFKIGKPTLSSANSNASIDLKVVNSWQSR